MKIKYGNRFNLRPSCVTHHQSIDGLINLLTTRDDLFVEFPSGIHIISPPPYHYSSITGVAQRPTPGTHSLAPSSAQASTCRCTPATSPGWTPAASRCPACVWPRGSSPATDRAQTPPRLSTEFWAGSHCSAPESRDGCSGSGRTNTRTRAALRPHPRPQAATRTYEGRGEKRHKRN